MPFVEMNTSTGTWKPKSDVRLEQLGESPPVFGKRAEFQILDDFGYVYPGQPSDGGSGSPAPGALLRVHRCDKTDLASVPQALWGVIASYGSHTMPALLHDRLCVVAEHRPGKGLRLRRWADQLFRRMLQDEAGAGVATRWAMWSAIRLFSFRPLGLLAVVSVLSLDAAMLAVACGAAVPGSAWIVLAALGAVTVLLAVVRSVEHPATSPEDSGPPTAPRRFRVDAFASLLGALAVAVPAVPLFAPPVLGSVVAGFLLRITDLALHHLVVTPLAALLSRLFPYPEPDGTTGSETSSGDSLLRRVTTEPKPAAGGVFPKL